MQDVPGHVMQAFLQVTAQAVDQGLWVGGVQNTGVRGGKYTSERCKVGGRPGHRGAVRTTRSGPRPSFGRDDDLCVPAPHSRMVWGLDATCQATRIASGALNAETRGCCHTVLIKTHRANIVQNIPDMH